MLVCLLTPSCGYVNTVIILIGLSTITLVTELIWTQIVYNKFPILKTDEERRKKIRVEAERERITSKSNGKSEWMQGFREELADWRELAAIPAFWRECLLSTVETPSS
jgi:hypothetical protein